ncbi:type VI secretion system tube protein Hcp [Pendulispora albinea]|uniref:Type VI secretion system tube protein Hcp n=1 Tax=Pendulispora albinea TaxID=2741071 RepID=A0ABZ2LLY5_9BACT
MTSNQQAIIYVEIKGSKQGRFKSDPSRAGKDKPTCVAYRFGIEVPHETRGSADIVRNQPLCIICEWNSFVVQCMQAAWNNSEPLEEVVLTFMRQEAGGSERPYKTMTLKNATIALLRNGSADPDYILRDDYRDLTLIGFLAEEILVESGDDKAQYKRRSTGP